MRSSSHEPVGPVPGLLRNYNFLLLWSAYAVSAAGDHLSEMAILKTQNAVDPTVDITPLAARMSFVFFVPFFLLSPFAGLLADRFPRRALMIAADLFRCAVMFSFAALIAVTQGWGTWGPFLPLMLVGMFACVFSPARSALLPTLIRPGQLVRANGLISGLGIIATMAAALIGGYLADRYDPQVAFRLDAATFLGSAALLAFLRPPRRRGDDRTVGGLRSTLADLRSAFADLSSALADLRAGLSYARTHRRVLELLAIAGLVWFCGPLVNSVIPAVVRDVYDGTYQMMSVYRGLLGLGFVFGAITIAVLGDALKSEIALTWGLLGISLGIAVFASSVFLPLETTTLRYVGGAGIVLAGFSAVSVMASFNSLLQRIVADRFRGRIFGVKDLICTGALLAATGFIGIPRWENVDSWVGYILVGVAIVTLAAGVTVLAVRLGRGTHGKALAFAENLNEFVAKFWWRLRRVGRSTVPRKGAVIITANHTCSADPLFLHAAAPYRPIAFMVAAEYISWPIIKFFLRLVECIPVKRDGRDVAATKQAIRHLREGKAIGIFIYGRIVAPGESVEPRGGVAMLALKTGAKVIPAHISGAVHCSGILRGLIARHRAQVRFGPPVDLSEFQGAHRSRQQLRAATRKILDAINTLAPGEKGTTSREELESPQSREREQTQ